MLILNVCPTKIMDPVLIFKYQFCKAAFQKKKIFSGSHVCHIYARHFSLLLIGHIQHVIWTLFYSEAMSSIYSGYYLVFLLRGHVQNARHMPDTFYSNSMSVKCAAPGQTSLKYPWHSMC